MEETITIARVTPTEEDFERDYPFRLSKCGADVFNSETWRQTVVDNLASSLDGSRYDIGLLAKAVGVSRQTMSDHLKKRPDLIDAEEAAVICRLLNTDVNTVRGVITEHGTETCYSSVRVAEVYEDLNQQQREAITAILRTYETANRDADTLDRMTELFNDIATI